MSRTRKTWRLVKPLGDAVAKLRLEKGWTIEALADKAGCTPKTISNVENSKKTFVRTICFIAQALEVPCKSLISTEDAAHTPLPTVTIQLNFAVTLTGDGWQQASELIKQLIRIAEVPGLVTAKNVKEGSLIVLIEIDIPDLPLILDAFHKGKLDHLRLAEITITSANRKELAAAGFKVYDRWRRELPETKAEDGTASAG